MSVECDHDPVSHSMQSFENKLQEIDTQFNNLQMSTEEFDESRFSVQFDCLRKAILSEDSSKQLEAIIWFRKLLSRKAVPIMNPLWKQAIKTAIEVEVLSRIVSFLSLSFSAELQYEAAWVITNIAAGSTEHTTEVIKHGGIDALIQLLSAAATDDVKAQAVWALGNIAGDSSQSRDLVLKAGALEPLLKLCQNDANLSILRNATWTLSNCLRNKPKPDYTLIKPALPVLAHVIQSHDEEVLTNVCWALSFLVNDTDSPPNPKIQGVIDIGIVPRLVVLLSHDSPKVITPALRTIGHILTGSDDQTQAVINCGMLACLSTLLVHPKKLIRMEACWTISNITAGNKDQISAVIHAKLIHPLVSILKSKEEEFHVQKQAAWALSNVATGGSPEHIQYLVDAKCLEVFVNLSGHSDTEIILVALDALENIFRVGRDSNGGNKSKYEDEIEKRYGLEKIICELQKHENSAIRDKVERILKIYIFWWGRTNCSENQIN